MLLEKGNSLDKWVNFGSQFHITVHHCGKGNAKEREAAGHIASVVRKQGESEGD